MRSRIRTGAFAVIALCAASWVHAQSDGIRETERFVKTGESTSESVSEGGMKTKAALDAYNALVQGNTRDMKGDYRRLVNSQKTMNNQMAVARKTVAEMDKQAAVYFTSRSAALTQIQDTSLRDQAKSRLDESRAEYDRVKAALRDAGDALAPFAQDLSDQIKYLGAELTPSATESLKPQAEKLNERGANVFMQVDAAVGAANGYFHALKPEREPVAAEPPAR